MFPTTFNWGFSLQYSLPYYNSHVGEIGNEFLKHLIPTVEFAFSTPTANASAGDLGNDRNDPARRRLYGGQVADRR